MKLNNTSCNPNIDDSIKPDYKVFWINRITQEKGHSVFFTYEFGAEVINAVFKVIYPGRKITRIQQIDYN